MLVQVQPEGFWECGRMVIAVDCKSMDFSSEVQILSLPKGCSQMVRHWFLMPTSKGSSPFALSLLSLMVERQFCKLMVAGSSPAGDILARVFQLVEYYIVTVAMWFKSLLAPTGNSIGQSVCLISIKLMVQVHSGLILPV